MPRGPWSRVWQGVQDLRETLSLVPVAFREVIQETRGLAQLLWVEHDGPARAEPVLLDEPKGTREIWWQVAATALKVMRPDPESGSDQVEVSVEELARHMRVGHARALDRDAIVPAPSREELDEWERLAALTLAWWAEERSGS